MTVYQPLTPKNKSVPDSAIEQEKCPMVQFVELIAGKWAIPILYRLIVIAAPIRFGELQRAIAPIT
ncbi:winged helix-turn-helix transcriptional regulator, partial [Yersinia proxima]